MIGRQSLGKRGIWAAVAALLVTGCPLDATEAVSSGGTASDSGTSTGAVASTTGTPADTTAGSAAVSSSTTDTGTSSGPGISADSTSALVTTSGATTEGDSGSSETGGPPALVDCGLLARHYLDEASSGTGPATAFDASGNGVDLTLSYGGNMAYDEVDGHRGLRWQASGQGGVASVGVDGTTIADLEGTTAATIEVVVQLQSVVSDGSRLVHIGMGSEGGRFTLASDGADELHYRNYDTEYGNWPFDFALSDRAVVHLVIDTAQPDEANRVRMFVDGVAVAATSGLPPQDQTFQVGGRSYAIGNRANGSRSPQGLIYYAASYACALSDAEVAHNAAILHADDDTPGA